MNIVPWQSQDEKPSAAQKIIFKLLFETPPSPRVPGPWWSELFGQRHQKDLGLKLLCPFTRIDSSRVVVCFSLISFRFRCHCWPTWEWTITLITVQYFFILWKSLSSCFCPVSSCHFLLYLVKAFFLLLYLKREERTWDPVQVRSSQHKKRPRTIAHTSFYKICACTHRWDAPQRWFWESEGHGRSGCIPQSRLQWPEAFRWLWPPPLPLSLIVLRAKTENNWLAFHFTFQS